MHAMGSVTKLFNQWEIQLLVLLSFTLQLFLFFSGRLRRHTTSGILRLSIWAAYLGADLVAVYALGYLSKHEDITVERHAPRGTHALAFFWAPFLLIHLGGQDTITAFSMEDNNLWLRHLLNVVVQVILAIYVFWKSIGRHSVDLLVSGIFVFSAGVIKYGERIWSLKCGSLKDLESSTGGRYKNRLPQEINGDGYDHIVCEALHSMPKVYEIFSGRSLFASVGRPQILDSKMPKIMSIALGVMYDDLYTKALVLRTTSVIILRCISQVFVVVAFVLFYADEKQKYNKADIAITYSLFIGGLLIEICAVLAWMMSPWTWAWLKVRKFDTLARLTWFILSSDIGWPEKKQWWPKSMGQYSLVRWLSESNMQPRTSSQRLMAMIKRVSADWFGVKRKKIFWVSKILDTENVDVNKMMMEYVVKEIILLEAEMTIAPRHKGRPREWPNLGRLFEETQVLMVGDFARFLVWLHFVSEAHLSKYSSPPPSPLDMESSTSAAEVPDPGMVWVSPPPPPPPPSDMEASTSSAEAEVSDLGMVEVSPPPPPLPPPPSDIEASTSAAAEVPDLGMVEVSPPPPPLPPPPLPPPPSDIEASTSAAAEVPDLGMVDICRKLSNYMMYLLVNHPSMLPLAASAAAALEKYQEPEEINFLDYLDKKKMPEPSKEALEELVYMWTRLLIYAAGKSTRVEMHVARLSAGGELITLVWLLMAYYGLGESQSWRIQIANADTAGNSELRQAYAFYIT